MPLDARTYRRFQAAWWSGSHWCEVQIADMFGELTVFRGPISEASKRLDPRNPLGNPTAALFDEHLDWIARAHSFFAYWHHQARRSVAASMALEEAARPAPVLAQAAMPTQMTDSEVVHKEAPEVDAFKVLKLAPEVATVGKTVGRPPSGPCSAGGMLSRHSEAISMQPSRAGATASKVERVRKRMLELESRVVVNRAKQLTTAQAAASSQAKHDKNLVHPDVEYIYAEAQGRVLWGKGDAATHMELAVERGWEFLEFGAVTGHPEMKSLRQVCLYTLGLAAWTSFHERVKRKIDVHAIPGITTVLSSECEQLLEEHLLCVADMGWGKDAEQVQALAFDIARSQGVHDFMASQGWYEGFMDRHPVLTRRLGNNLERTRVGGSNVQLGKKYMKQIIGDCIQHCESQNRQLGLVDPQMRGSDWSNLDEVAFDQGIDRIKVVCRKGQRQSRQSAAERGDHLTMIVGISASQRFEGDDGIYVEGPGKLWMPFAIVKGKEDKYKNLPLPDAPATMKHAMSENAYLTEDLWDEEVVDWIISEINLVRQDPQRWHALTMDGAGPHQFCWSALRKLWQAHVYVPGMPSHTSHVFQNLDTHCFHPTKAVKRLKVREYKHKHGVLSVPKWQFPAVAYDCLVIGCKPSTIEASFRDNGIFPYNPNWVEENPHHFQVSELYLKHEPGTVEAAHSNLQKFEQNLARCGLRAQSHVVETVQPHRCDNYPLCDTWDRMDGCCACPALLHLTSTLTVAEAERIENHSLRCPADSLLPSLLLLGTEVEVVALAERTTDQILLASMPRPHTVTQGTKRKRPNNKIGERNSDPKHLNHPDRVLNLERLEQTTQQQKEAKAQKKEEKADYQSPIMTVMIHTGWLQKGSNLTGKLLDDFFKANYDPVNGFFKSKPRCEGTKAPSVEFKTRFISDHLVKFKRENPTLDTCTAIKWKFKPK